MCHGVEEREDKSVPILIRCSICGDYAALEPDRLFLALRWVADRSLTASPFSGRIATVIE